MAKRTVSFLACVASVSVGFGSKERPRNGVFGILPARKMGREPKKERWGRGGEGRSRLRTNPWILKTPVRWRTGLVIGWGSLTFLTCVDQRSKRRGRHFLFEACLQKALTFLEE